MKRLCRLLLLFVLLMTCGCQEAPIKEAEWKAHEGGVGAVATSQDGNRILVAGWNSEYPRLWSSSGKEIEHYDCGDCRTADVSMTADGRLGYAVNARGFWELDLETDVPDLVLIPNRRTFRKIEVSPDGNEALMICIPDVWHLRLPSGEVIKEFRGIPKTDTLDMAVNWKKGLLVTAVAQVVPPINPDTDEFSAPGGRVRLWELNGGQELQTWDFPKDVESVDLDAEGERILAQVSREGEREIHLLHRSGEARQSWPGWEPTFVGSRILSVLRGDRQKKKKERSPGAIQVRDLDGNLKTTIPVENDFVKDIEPLSPDGFAVGWLDGTLQLWRFR